MIKTNAHAACARTRKIFVWFFHWEGDWCAPINLNAYYYFCRNSEFSEFAIRFCVVGVQVPTFVKFLFVSKLSCRIWRVCALTFPGLTTWFERPLVFPNISEESSKPTLSKVWVLRIHHFWNWRFPFCNIQAQTHTFGKVHSTWWKCSCHAWHAHAGYCQCQ